MLQEGYLRKRGGPFKRWKKRFFSLTSKVLTYRTAPGRPQVGSVMTGAMLGVRAEKKPTHFVLIAVHKQYLLEAPSPALRDEWLAALSAAIGNIATRPSLTHVQSLQ